MPRASGNAPPRVLPPRPESGESTVVGSVVEAGTRAPIPGAEIVLRHPQAEFAVLATSRADGKFTLDRVPGVVGARVFVSATGFGPRIIRDVHVPPHDRLDLGAIELARGLPIQGVVVTALGAPIAGAQVDLIETPAMAPGSFENLVSMFRELRDDDEALDQVLTAADGTFTFQSAAPGKYLALATKPGWQVRYSRPFTVEPGLSPPGLTLRLVEGRALRGVVKDEAGNPVAGAAVAALEVDPQNIFLVKSQKTVTSREGRFSYASFGAGDVALIVSAPGYSGTSKSNLKAGGKDVELVLRKAARIEGRVYDRASGKGLPDAVVVAIQLDQSIALEETRTGPEGEYVIEAGPTGDKVSVFAKLPGYAMAELIEPPPGSEEKPPWEALEREEVATGAVMKRDIPMIGGGSLSGRVVDEASNEGIAGADVIVQATDGLAFLGCNDPVTTRSASDGTFSLPKLGAGKVTARAEAAGYIAPHDIPRTSSDADTPEEPEPPPAAAEIRPGGAVTGIVIKLRRGAEIDVLVTDPEGAPMAGATVSWVMPGEELGNGFGPAKRPRLVATDAAGRARIKGVARTAGIVIAARHQSFPTGDDVTIDATSPPREPVKIVLSQGASLAGVVIDPDGRPAADRCVILSPSHGDVARAFGEWTWEGHRVVTDAAGKFLLENMPCGDATIDVEEKRAPNESGALFHHGARGLPRCRPERDHARRRQARGSPASARPHARDQGTRLRRRGPAGRGRRGHRREREDSLGRRLRDDLRGRVVPDRRPRARGVHGPGSCGRAGGRGRRRAGSSRGRALDEDGRGRLARRRLPVHEVAT